MNSKRVIEKEQVHLLDDFKAEAKIDYLTTALPVGIKTYSDASRFTSAVKGKVNCASRWRSNRDDWVTIHDPQSSDFQYLLDHHPEAQVRAIEIAIDFTLLDGSSDRERLEELFKWFAVRLFPQRHHRMKKEARKFFDTQTGKYTRDTLISKCRNTTVVWGSGFRQTALVKLYIKTHDNKKPVAGQVAVRLEVTLYISGCQRAEVGLYRIAELPQFINNMRRYLSGFLYVASGIKPKIKRTRTNDPAKATRAAGEAQKELDRVGQAWSQKGASWAAKHGYDTIPDTRANRMIGVALKTLREELRALKLTKKVAEHAGYEVAETLASSGSRQAPSADTIDSLPPTPSFPSSSTTSFLTSSNNNDNLVPLPSPSTPDAIHPQGECEARAADGNGAMGSLYCPAASTESTRQPIDTDDRAVGDGGESSGCLVLPGAFSFPQSEFIPDSCLTNSFNNSNSPDTVKPVIQYLSQAP